MNTRSREDQKYLDDLLLHLRWRDVPGARIGEILAEVEAHADATGEPLVEAFGSPKAYAKQWERGAPNGFRYWLPLLPAIALNGVGGWTLANGGYAIGAGEPALFGLPGIVVALVGVGIALVGMAMIKIDRVVDPRSGRPITSSRRAFLVLIAAAYGGFVVLMAGLGAVLAALTP